MNRKPSSALLARTAPLSMALALFACSEPSGNKSPPPPSAATVFKDVPPPAPTPAPEGTSAAPQGTPPAANAPKPPEQLFFNLGCKACHGPGSAHASRLVSTRGKPAEEIAKWILHPEQMRPGTLMPGYAKRITQEEALSLANWIKAGNPAPSQ